MSLFEPTVANLILFGAITGAGFLYALRTMPLFSSHAFNAFVGGSLLIGFYVWAAAGLPLLPVALVIFSGMLALPLALIGSLNLVFGSSAQR
jgi:heme exporter protein D